MILLLYFYTSILALFTVSLNIALTKAGYVVCNITEKLEEMNRILKKHPEFENILNFAMDNPMRYILLVCFIPIVNIFLIISIENNILTNINK